MPKPRFLNQKLGKRMSRKFGLLKSRLATDRAGKRQESLGARFPKKGPSREEKG